MAENKRIFRNEWKYLISLPEAELLQRRLTPFLQLDPHSGENGYSIRSLYFDDYSHSSYREKLMGTYYRKKWRIRIYNYSDSHIALERKIKEGSYIYKESASLTREEFEKLLNLDFTFLLKRTENLCREFYVECESKYLRPMVIVDYERVPLILEEGTVRITFDRDVRAAIGGFDIFDPKLPTRYVLEPGKLVLEVKYTEFLPAVIQKLLPTDGQEFTALSKYTLCYEAAYHLTEPVSGVTKNFLGGRKL